MNKQELITQWEKLASKMSYFNAAEGASYSREKSTRNECKNELAKVSKLCEENGIDLNELKANGNYLI